MNKKLYWTRVIICIVTLLMVTSGSVMAQTQESIKSISFSGGTKKTILTYGLHAALSQAGRINLDSSGRFSVNVPSTTTTAPTKVPPPFSVEVKGFLMQGTWSDKDAQGTFTLTSTIISKRVERSDLADPMGNDEWYYLATYYYDDTVTASGTITQEADTLVFTVDAVVNRAGTSRLVSKIVNNGQTTTGDNPTITDKSGSFSETARYSFVITETGKSAPKLPPVTQRPTNTPHPNTGCGNADPAGRIVRFGDLYGEVNVRPNWEDDDAYIFAELSTPLCHDDRIRTLPKSGAILSFSDMTSFVMKEDTIIVLDLEHPRQTKLGIIAGNIWVNLKRMVEDGSMDVEMAQAVAGIKGTTVIFEETGSTSTIKVIEGTVEVRPNAGAPLTLSDGEMVSATNGIASAVVPFSVEDEMQNWDENVQQMTEQALAERKSNPPSSFSTTWIFFGAIPGLICFGLSFVILLAGFFVKNKKISILGLVLIAIMICITLAAFAINGGFQLLASSP